MIQVEHISKTFKVSRRNAGLSKTFKALFYRQHECITPEYGNCNINGRVPWKERAS